MFSDIEIKCDISFGLLELGNAEIASFIRYYRPQVKIQNDEKISVEFKHFSTSDKFITLGKTYLVTMTFGPSQLISEHFKSSIESMMPQGMQIELFALDKKIATGVLLSTELIKHWKPKFD